MNIAVIQGGRSYKRKITRVVNEGFIMITFSECSGGNKTNSYGFSMYLYTVVYCTDRFVL